MDQLHAVPVVLVIMAVAFVLYRLTAPEDWSDLKHRRWPDFRKRRWPAFKQQFRAAKADLVLRLGARRS